MSRFDTYFLLKEEDVIQYVREKSHFFPPDAKLACKEIGDGNLNYVYRVEDVETGRSLIAKQAGVTLRISKEMKLSTERNRKEAQILRLHAEVAPGLVPEVFAYDKTMCLSLMEDMRDFELMRYALMQHKTFPNFADQITTFMVNTLLSTSDLVMDHQEKKALVVEYMNPELCEITEDLVLTEPVNDNKGRNKVFPPIRAFADRELYQDNALHLEVAKLKFTFLNKAESLIHGDLHTGSIFVNKEKTVVFDPEFAFYGPMGYDIGNVTANLMFAWCNGNTYKAEAFCAWVEKTIVEVVDMFTQKFKARFAESKPDVMARTEGFLDWYAGEILTDTAGYTGTELLRRTVGMAQNKDVTSIDDEAARARIDRINITAGKSFIMNREQIRTGRQFLDTFLEAVSRQDEELRSNREENSVKRQGV